MSNPVAVRLATALENRLIFACRDRLPRETCGVVFGAFTDDALIAEDYAIVRNASPTPDTRFAFDPNDWIAVCYEAQKNQRKLVGVFHSHPVGPGVPSAYDERALMPWDSYWIVSFADGQGAVSAYKHDARHGFLALPVVRVI